ncbi:MAG: Stp1/IreP family PP2C-type Ser/Thr phosphatase [Clostridia bacterium]|nr:Stp1/IreP family PP2C-type Ser/Thr phosphatase [Clostridia bacterium]
MRSFGKSDIGRLRSNNQDAFICGRLSDTVLFAVVCDGMGGANGGNVASAIAIRTIAERIASSYRVGMTTASMQNVLESAIAAANIEIYDRAAMDPELRGMGTTLVMAVAMDREILIAHVGDSRAYILLEDGGIEQLTRDHSVVQQMVERGQITPEEARTHPRRNFITRALGADVTVACDFTELTLPEEAKLLLCTDGLTNMLESDQIAAIVNDSPDRMAPQLLIDAANEAGGGDNITVAIMEEENGESETK